MFFFIIKCILRHAFPAHYIMLVQYISFQYRFAKENGNNQENQDGNKMGKYFFYQVVFHSLFFNKSLSQGTFGFHFQADKIMLF